jgi:hypothetical protein
MAQNEADRVRRARRYRTVDFAGPGQVWLDGQMVACRWAELEYPVQAVDSHQGTHRIHVLDPYKRPKLRIDGVAYYHADDPHEGW